MESPRFSVGRSLLSALLLWGAAAPAYAESGFWKDRRRALEDRWGGAPSSSPAAPLSNSSLALALPAVTARLAGLDAVDHRETLPAELPTASRSSRVPPWLAAAVGPQGSVQDIRVPAGATRTVIHIQDVHEVYDAQRRIAQLLEGVTRAVQSADHRAGASSPVLVGLEGASGAFRLEPFRQFVSSPAVAQTADLLLRNGLIAGPEYFGLTTASAVELWGVEDPAAYRANLGAVSGAAADQPRDDAVVATLTETLDGVKSRVFSPGLHSIDDKLADFAAGKLGLGAYLEFLSRQRRRAPLGEETRRFLNALEMERRLDFARVEAERGALIEKLVAALSVERLDGLLQSSLRLRQGRVSVADYESVLRDTARSAGVALGAYPRLGDYLRYVRATETIDKNGLLREVEDLGRAVLEENLQTADQRRLAVALDDRRLLAKLNDYRVTQDEWPRLAARSDVLRRLGTEVRDLARLAGRSAATIDTRGVVDRHLPFYTAAEARNRPLVGRLMDRWRDHPRARFAVLVAGGFHADALRRELADQGVGYISLVPALGDVSKIPHYIDALRRTPTSLDRLFAGERIGLKSPVELASDSLGAGQSKVVGAFAAAGLAEELRNALLSWDLAGDPLPMDRWPAEWAGRVQSLIDRAQTEGGRFPGLALARVDGRRLTAARSRDVLSIRIPLEYRSPSGKSLRVEAAAEFQLKGAALPARQGVRGVVLAGTESERLVLRTPARGLGAVGARLAALASSVGGGVAWAFTPVRDLWAFGVRWLGAGGHWVVAITRARNLAFLGTSDARWLGRQWALPEPVRRSVFFTEAWSKRVAVAEDWRTDLRNVLVDGGGTVKDLGVDPSGKSWSLLWTVDGQSVRLNVSVADAPALIADPGRASLVQYRPADEGFDLIVQKTLLDGARPADRAREMGRSLTEILAWNRNIEQSLAEVVSQVRESRGGAERELLDVERTKLFLRTLAIRAGLETVNSQASRGTLVDVPLRIEALPNLIPAGVPVLDSWRTSPSLDEIVGALSPRDITDIVSSGDTAATRAISLVDRLPTASDASPVLRELNRLAEDATSDAVRLAWSDAAQAMEQSAPLVSAWLSRRGWKFWGRDPVYAALGPAVLAWVRATARREALGVVAPTAGRGARDASVEKSFVPLVQTVLALLSSRRASFRVTEARGFVRDLLEVYLREYELGLRRRTFVDAPGAAAELASVKGLAAPMAHISGPGDRLEQTLGLQKLGAALQSLPVESMADVAPVLVLDGPWAALDPAEAREQVATFLRGRIPAGADAVQAAALLDRLLVLSGDSFLGEDGKIQLDAVFERLRSHYARILGRSPDFVQVMTDAPDRLVEARRAAAAWVIYLVTQTGLVEVSRDLDAAHRVTEFLRQQA